MKNSFQIVIIVIGILQLFFTRFIDPSRLFNEIEKKHALHMLDIGYKALGVFILIYTLLFSNKLYYILCSAGILALVYSKRLANYTIEDSNKIKRVKINRLLGAILILTGLVLLNRGNM